MNNNLIKLQSLARKYCINNHEKFIKIYEKQREKNKLEIVYSYTEADYNIFPRYLILSAILKEIESINIINVNNLEELKELILLSAETSSSDFIKFKDNRTAINAINEEKEKYSKYIIQLSEKEINNADILFYRRLLCESEKKIIYLELEKKWNVNEGHYYYPLADIKNKNLMALKLDEFLESIDKSLLKNILIKQKIDRFYELNEFKEDGDYITDISVFELYYSSEKFYSYEPFDWIIYISHENLITFGGDWLIEELKKNIENIEKLYYK